ncbi:GutQ Predicted sugar phosphate isomerase involved in capsule formation [actinobacterium SCGC AAA044-D11]
MADLSKALTAAIAAINTEISALSNFAKNLEANLKPALEIILASQGHIVVTGLGKSGLVGAKIVATLASTGTPSFFLHSGDALHGDSGALTPGDVLIVISNSGESAEVCAIAKMAKGWGNSTIAITKNTNSTLAKSCDAVIEIAFEKEADPLNLAPTTSTTLTIAAGDAIASALMAHRGFTSQDFGKRHPGGALGQATNK